MRGGSFDENSVYINNVEVYRPLLIRSGQQEGLSIINSDMVEKIGFSSGGFEAKYGDKMSSVLDIQYRRPTRFEGNVNASLLGAGVFLGYASKEKVTINGQQTAKFTMSHGLRYKSTRYLLGSLETKGEYRPNFLDYQTYITYQPNERWSLDIIGNISENHYNFHPTDRETSFGTMQNVKTFKVCQQQNQPALLCLPHQGTGDLRHSGTVLAERRTDTGPAGRGHLYGARP